VPLGQRHGSLRPCSQILVHSHYISSKLNLRSSFSSYRSAYQLRCLTPPREFLILQVCISASLSYPNTRISYLTAAQKCQSEWPRSKSCLVFPNSNTWNLGFESNWIHLCLWLFSVCVVPRIAGDFPTVFTPSKIDLGFESHWRHGHLLVFILFLYCLLWRQ
jgi:hypothetical protein